MGHAILRLFNAHFNYPKQTFSVFLPRRCQSLIDLACSGTNKMGQNGDLFVVIFTQLFLFKNFQVDAIMEKFIPRFCRCGRPILYLLDLETGTEAAFLAYN